MSGEYAKLSERLRLRITRHAGAARLPIFCDSKSVVSALSGPASDPPRSIAACAEDLPSLQIKNFHVLELVAGPGTDKLSPRRSPAGHKSETDLRTRKILRSNHADLRPDHPRRVHDQRNQISTLPLMA